MGETLRVYIPGIYKKDLLIDQVRYGVKVSIPISIHWSYCIYYLSGKS